MNNLINLVDMIGKRYGLGHDKGCSCFLCNNRRALAVIDNLKLKFGAKA